MAPNKSPAQVMAEQRARRAISERYIDSVRSEQHSDNQDRKDRSPPSPGDLAEAIIKKQLADEEGAERLKDATVGEVVDEVR
jgi:hypothetical protein